MDISHILDDPALRSEIERRFGPSLLKSVRSTTRAIAAPLELSQLRGPRLSAEEAVVLKFGRPVLFVRNNTFEIPQSDEWTARLIAAQVALNAILPSVGRIEVKNHPDFDWVGTGWLIGPRVIATNRHVAQEFARRSDAGFVFKRNPAGRTIGARIDYLEEHLESEELEVSVERILYISDEDAPDVAFLKLSEGADREPIPLGSPVAENPIAVIGYPAADSRRNPGPDMDRIFGNVYDVKRLAPGTLKRVQPDLLLHDCTTLGGNSGSVVIDLISGKAIGLHFGGQFLEDNYAVPSHVVAALHDALPV